MNGARPRRSVLVRAALAAVGAVALAGTAAAVPARAAGPAVQVWLTTTDDSGGRHVTRGLQQQDPVSFGTGDGSGTAIGVDDGTRYQTFTGAGASFTDTAAWLLNSSGALSGSARDEVMTKLFSPTDGIGLSFLRNPIGASDLARNSYTFDDVPAGQTDPNLDHFSLAHDQADVIPLTRQALQLDPKLTVMASPWTAPPWMKDNDSYVQGWLQAQYYPAYAQYFVKYLQGYRDAGVPVSYVTVQNEPTVGSDYPGMNWNGSGLDYFTGTDLLPALHAAGLDTKVLALDWNWDSYDGYGAPVVDDSAIRDDPNFGGIAWHGYSGEVGEQSTVHDKYPDVPAFDTEHSGGTWIGNQQQEDMHNIIDYTRNWGRSVTKWSLAVDQNGGPHNGGCGTCTGLVTVHNGDSESGRVDYTVEYYDMGQLTKFVQPGAVRVDSTASSAVPNVAWHDPDGSDALVAYNDTGADAPVTVTWQGQSFSYPLPAQTTATFTWSAAAAGHRAAGDAATGHRADGAELPPYDRH